MPAITIYIVFPDLLVVGELKSSFNCVKLVQCLQSSTATPFQF